MKFGSKISSFSVMTFMLFIFWSALKFRSRVSSSFREDLSILLLEIIAKPMHFKFLLTFQIFACPQKIPFWLRACNKEVNKEIRAKKYSLFLFYSLQRKNLW